MSNVVGEDRSSFQAVQGWGGDYFGFAKASEGPDWTDPTFVSNWANLKAEGKVRGAYHFFHPADDAVEQARYFVSAVQAHGGIEPGDVFIADVEILVGATGLEEYGTKRAAARAHQGLRAFPATDDVGPAALEFLTEVARLVPGHRVVLYTDLSMAKTSLTACTAYPLFIAYYAASPPDVHPWKSWVFWQAREGGGPGGGDVDYFAGDLAALDTWTRVSPAPLPAGWTYPPVRKLTGEGGDTSVKLEWDSPVQPAGQVPMPAIAEYEVALTPGPELAGPDVKTYPRFAPKGTSPETWQGGSLARKKQYTAGVRACAADGAHAGPWVKVTFSTT